MKNWTIIKSLFLLTINVVICVFKLQAEPMNNLPKTPIRAAIDHLNGRNPFVFFDLDLSEKEKNILKNLKINSTEEYNNYGHLGALEPEVKKFIQSLSPQNEAHAGAVAHLIGKIINRIVQGSGAETAWVAVRAFTATSEHNLPRWHQDGYYYAPYEGNSYKFAVTLKGPGTLFYNLPFHLKGRFVDLARKGTEQNEYNRQAIATLLEQSPENTVVSQPYYGAVFIVGSDNAAIHSEPPIHEERLFISVLPGNHEQIKEWEGK